MKRTAVTVTNKKRIAIGFIIIAVLMVLLGLSRCVDTSSRRR